MRSARLGRGCNLLPLAFRQNRPVRFLHIAGVCLAFLNSFASAQQGRVLNSRDHLVSPVLIVADEDGRVWRREWSLPPEWSAIPVSEISLPTASKPIRVASQTSDRRLAIQGRDRSVLVHTGDAWISPPFDGIAGSTTWSPDGSVLLIADRSNYRNTKQIDVHRFDWKDNELAAGRVHRAINASQARWVDSERIFAEGAGLYQATWIETKKNHTHSLDYKDNATRRRPGTEIELFARTAWVVDGKSLRGVLGEQNGVNWNLQFATKPADAIIRVREAGGLTWLFVDNNAVVLSKSGEPLTPMLELPDAPSIIGPTFSSDDVSGVYITLWNEDQFWLVHQDDGLGLKR